MENPNVVLIVIDALRPDHLSTFGYKTETDPNLKRIAKEGVLFRNHFSVANGTAPAVTTILSGLLPSTHGVLHQFPYVKPEEYANAEKIRFWLPSFLQQKGYHTMAFDWMYEWFEKGFDLYTEGDAETDSIYPPTDMVVDIAIRKIKEATKPFFAFIHFWDTHFPFPNTKFNGSGKNDSAKILGSISDEKRKEYVRRRMDAVKLYSVDDVKDKYDETIKIVDSGVGQIYDMLIKEGLIDNTVLIILGDHGEIIHDHGIYFANCSLFDVAIKAPIIMKIPGMAAKTVDDMVQNVDIAPTILDLLGANGEKLEGLSLLPALKDGKSVRRDTALVFDAFANDVRAARTAKSKVIYAKDGFCNMCKSVHHSRVEEYNLVIDPGESKNVSAGESELLKLLG